MSSHFWNQHFETNKKCIKNTVFYLYKYFQFCMICLCEKKYCLHILILIKIVLVTTTKVDFQRMRSVKGRRKNSNADASSIRRESILKSRLPLEIWDSLHFLIRPINKSAGVGPTTGITISLTVYQFGIALNIIDLEFYFNQPCFFLKIKLIQWFFFSKLFF